MTTMEDSTLATLHDLAIRAKELSYAPYSGYHVGASVVTVDGELYGGCGNIENMNYTLTKHGEETAIIAAIQAGAMAKNGTNFLKTVYLVPATNAAGELVECLPCGGCRQFVHEFGAVDGQWAIEQLDGSVKYYGFEEFLPFPYVTPKKVTRVEEERYDKRI